MLKNFIAFTPSVLDFKTKNLYNYIRILHQFKFIFDRDVAQFGSAPVLGTGGRRFESCHPDLTKKKRKCLFF